MRRFMRLCRHIIWKHKRMLWWVAVIEIGVALAVLAIVPLETRGMNLMGYYWDALVFLASGLLIPAGVIVVAALDEYSLRDLRFQIITARLESESDDDI